MAQLLHLTGQALRDPTGAPYLSAKAFFYETGTTTPKNTYSDAGLTSANTNPVIADGTTGTFPDIYLLAGRYKVVLQQSDGTSIDTWDPLDSTSQIVTLTSLPAQAYPFLRVHNSTDGNVSRRNAANAAWILEGPVDSLLNAATVTEQLAGTETAKSATPDSVAALWQRGTDIASASTLSLPAGGGGLFNVTGTTNVTGISSAVGGREIEFLMSGAVKFTHNGTSLIMPGAKDYITHAGEMLRFRNEAATDGTGSNWRCFGITPAASPINASTLLTKTANYTIVAADKNKLIAFTIASAATATLPAANAVNNGAELHIANETGSTAEAGLTLARAGADTIDNALTARIIYPGQRVTLVSDGTSKWTTKQGTYYYFSGNQTITAAGALTLAHGLGLRPNRWWIALRNLGAEGNYSTGDVLPVGFTHVDATQYGAAVVSDATNLNVRYGATAAVFQIPNKTTGAVLSITPANWAALFYASE